MSVASTSSPLRRTPTQRRSQDRIERILDAADQELERTGTLDTRAVASRAGISIGSLYHWFPDKESIALALAVRYWDSLADVVSNTALRLMMERETEPSRASYEEPVTVVVGALADGYRARPGFLALWFGDLRSAQIRDATRPSRDRVAAVIAQMLQADYPLAGVALCERVARMTTLLGDGIMREAFRISRAGDSIVLEEGIYAIRYYLERRLTAGAS